MIGKKRHRKKSRHRRLGGGLNAEEDQGEKIGGNRRTTIRGLVREREVRSQKNSLIRPS